jgi:hypothetical protein
MSSNMAGKVFRLKCSQMLGFWIDSPLVFALNPGFDACACGTGNMNKNQTPIMTDHKAGNPLYAFDCLVIELAAELLQSQRSARQTTVSTL